MARPSSPGTSTPAGSCRAAIIGAVERPVGASDIEMASVRLAGTIRRTPLLRPGPGSFGLTGLGDLVLKLELLQYTGSFKPRGAANRLLSGPIPAVGVAAASGGNHGQAVAWVARRLGVPAIVFVPEVSSVVKRRRIAELGAEVRVEGAVYDDAQAACSEHVRRCGALEVHPYDDVAVVAGQGTVARELHEDAPGLDTVLVAVGGGGLIAGVATWYAGSGCRVIAVEPSTSACLHAALEAGQPVTVEVAGIAADSLGARRLGAVPWAQLHDRVAASVVVDDDAIVSAQRALWRECRLATEPGGATALAALLTGAYVPEDGERIGVVLCGGNVEPATLT
jgi:threonine dehydratase